VRTVEEVLAAMDILHQRGCKTIVMTSSNIGAQDHLTCISSSVEGKSLAFLL